MEEILMNIEWATVVVSTVVTFLIGWVWYSPVLFVKPWMNGLPAPAKWQAPMWMPMLAQLGATLIFAMAVNVMLNQGATALFVLVTLALMGFVKSNGLYSGKTKMAISVEVLYILVMAIVMVGINVIF